MDALAQLEFELAYYDSAVQHFNQFTSRTPYEKKKIQPIWILGK